jgi:hypothetical protein
MSIDDQAAGGGASRWGWSRLPRPTGIRNGGLLLVLVALAAVVALVDEPPELGDGRRLPSIFQTLPPPTGITALPPAVAQPRRPRTRSTGARRRPPGPTRTAGIPARPGPRGCSGATSRAGRPGTRVGRGRAGPGRAGRRRR